MFLSHVLGLIGSIEVLAGQGTFRARHIAADDEVGGTEVLPDDHVLNGLPRPSHLHGIREVGPAEVLARPLLVLWLFLQNLIGLDTCGTIDVPRLRGTTGGMHQDDAVLHVLVGVHQQLEVRLVHRISVLEGHHLFALRQRGAHLRRGVEALAPHRVEARRQAMQFASQVELPQLREELRHRGMLRGGGAITRLGFLHLVRFEDLLSLQDS
mmetsp:Transcript_7963/g.16450  ORF Transcript_7963/g.16450 Transcript_7963/m.16450 type:complete len:211 (+) Transcript_7963:349-981(+)